MVPISRKQVIERLRNVDLGGGSHESLSAIAKAVYEPAGGWTIVACEALRQTFVRLLGGDAAQGGYVTNELPDLLRKALEGSYEGSKGDIIGNIAQLIGCKSRITFAVIDALADKVEQALSEAYEVGHIDGFDEAERWLTEQGDWLDEHEDAMAEHGWVRGPIVADGKLMAKEHMVVYSDGDVGVIVETRFNDDNWFVLVDFGEGVSARFVWVLPKSLTHYHEPTTEDVLREFAQCWDDPMRYDRDELVAEYAAKLQLREEA